MSELKFLIFSDFHYKKKMYPATVRDLNTVILAAKDFGASLLIHAGDFSNDYSGSPEIVSAYLDNAADLPVYGCYGNHELETAGNSMYNVTPLLSNRKESVIFGTADGKIGDGSIAYYYTDIEKYRFIFLDSNYSYSPEGALMHNLSASWGCPTGNTGKNSFGDAQIEWLSSSISDAREKGLSCIVVSHASCAEGWGGECDAKRIREIFREANNKRERTVILAINGHYHTSNIATFEGVTYIDCPATINGYWQSERFDPYREEDESNPKYIFKFEDYDENGKLIGVSDMPYSKLRMGAQSLFYDKPAYVRVSISDGGIKADFSEMNYSYGITKK